MFSPKVEKVWVRDYFEGYLLQWMNTKMDSLKASRVNYRPIHTHRNDTIQGDSDRPQDPNHFPNPCKHNLRPSAILKNLNEGKLLRRRINNVATRFTSYLSANQRFFRPVVQSCNLTSIYFPLFVVLWKWTLSADVHDLKSLVRSISMWKSFEELRQAITDFNFQVFLSALHFGKYGLQPRV